MREIKFRAFENENGRNRMFSWEEVKKDFEMWLNCKDTFVMQFTGLYDINGKEIYEGDIVLGSSGNIKYMVHYDSGNIRPLMLEHSLVIGNIYENPELL